jgi:saccharopine dehydrogenase-like NADP-dependent oxidoreductase
VSTVLLAGVGEVGVRAARQLLDTPGVDRVLVGARDGARARETARALDDGAESVELKQGAALPSGVDAIASAVPRPAETWIIDAAIEQGIAVASVTEDASVLAGIDTAARAGAARVVTGCALAPGLSDVLARHAASALDAVDEVHVARFGVAGNACLAAARGAQRAQVLEWREGALVTERGHGAELIWFPDPVGARECELVSAGIEQLVAAVPGVRRASVRLGLPHTPRVKLPGPFGLLTRGRQDPGIGWGAVRAEVWGTRGDTRTTVVYGVIERTGVAAGTVLGVTAAWLAGALPGLGPMPGPGAAGLGAVVSPVPFLAELARRGVKAAAFEGVPVG